MANKMLIDAAHPEETRVVVLRGNRVEEFDFESASRKQLRGNIYLAKVTRVEPSLQAAFVDYGGNRHGFLAFSEIHPDYYQIPVADRQALIEEEERALAEADAKATEADDKAAAIEEAQNGEATPASVEMAAATDGDAVVSESPTSTATEPETERTEPSAPSEPGDEIAASDEAAEPDGRDGDGETELVFDSAPRSPAMAAGRSRRRKPPATAMAEPQAMGAAATRKRSARRSRWSATTASNRSAPRTRSRSCPSDAGRASASTRSRR